MLSRARSLRLSPSALLHSAPLAAFASRLSSAAPVIAMTRATRSTRLASSSASAASSSSVASSAVAAASAALAVVTAPAETSSRKRKARGGDVAAEEEASADAPAAAVASGQAKGKRKANTAAADSAAADVDAAAVAAAAPAASKRAKTAASAMKAPAASKTKKGKAGAAAATAASIPSSSFKFGTLSRDLEEELRLSRPTGAATVLIGVDEAGRGPLAGPVVCAAAFVPPGVTVEGVHDSKKMSEAERESAFAALTAHPLVRHAVAILEHTEIDQINILEATMRGMQRAAEALHAQLQSAAPAAAAAAAPAVDLVLIDGNRIPKGLTLPAESVVKGDSKIYSIAAASIIAKVTRDRIMLQHHETWPQYNFAQHKGYGVGEHMRAIHRHGPCPIHRMTFAPMKHMKPREAATAASTPAAAAAAAADALAGHDAPAVLEGKRSRSKKK